MFSHPLIIMDETTPLDEISYKKEIIELKETLI